MHILAGITKIKTAFIGKKINTTDYKNLLFKHLFNTMESFKGHKLLSKQDNGPCHKVRVIMDEFLWKPLVY